MFRMTQASENLPLDAKPAQHLLRVRPVPQEFHGHLMLEVLFDARRPVYGAHAAAADLLDDLVAPDRSPDPGKSCGSGNQLLDALHGGRVDETRWPFVRDEQGTDFLAQLIVAGAGLLQPGVTGRSFSFQRGIEDFLDLPPTRWRHGGSIASSRLSHARAEAHSRFTVGSEISSACAVCSMVSPPK